uniref:SAP domain-containing protein n=1 Tax=Mola mola TaxID=94237 RepID=A0A3Q4BMR3_MOLML
MTLLASERSLLIRSKFRSVSSISSPLSLPLLITHLSLYLAPSFLSLFASHAERTVCGAQRHKKARQASDLTERIQHLPGPVEKQQKHTLPLETGEPYLISLSTSSGPPSFPDVLEDDVSSSPNEQHGVRQSPGFTSLPGLSGNQLLISYLNFNILFCLQSGLALLPATERNEGNVVSLQTARPPSPTCSPTLPTSFNFNHLSRPRKPRDSKPKMKKLKYHQYIPPDQRGDPAYSHLLKQQQVFLQLQILQNNQQQLQPQQQLTVVTRYANIMTQYVSILRQIMKTVTASVILPVAITVSELRQQLRKRGLPVSGTKPALLQRLRPFQLPYSCLTPAPLCQLGTSLDPLTSCPSLPSSQSPGSSSNSRLESPMQITASPGQSVPCGIRSLEEELQEAIQKAQMDPRQSIDDILDEPLTCVGKYPIIDKECNLIVLSSQASQQHNKDDFLPSPLCSSLLLELPPSPAVINPSQIIPALPPPPICTSPLSSTGKSRKRRAPTLFDAADWLETLTSGLRPLTPPAAPFVESDFSLDSDLNVSRVLDLMIEQW